MCKGFRLSRNNPGGESIIILRYTKKADQSHDDMRSAFSDLCSVLFCAMIFLDFELSGKDSVSVLCK